MPTTGVMMVTTELPGPVHHVWDRRERVLVVDEHATPEHVARAWAEVTADLAASAPAA